MVNTIIPHKKRDYFETIFSIFPENLVNINSMKQKYRMIDAVIQVALLVAWLLMVFIEVKYAIYFYFIVGAWFLVSLVIHRLLDNNTNSAFNTFLVIIACVIVAMALGFILSPVFFIVLYMLLFCGPVMALTYTIACITEIKNLNKRPINLLK